ncbi:hypothetical protein NDU88_001818 [Pleurodeles waltl]|uniref:Uncharacterized protein n=1 Tax=Pleurodeles waltl TaxID=8319 RepID=A0AAV7UV59_PLEWA|nr:hypothetical protein NDU88_001818 [Pleurodeles waltl]
MPRGGSGSPASQAWQRWPGWMTLASDVRLPEPAADGEERGIESPASLRCHRETGGEEGTDKRSRWLAASASVGPRYPGWLAGCQALHSSPC